MRLVNEDNLSKLLDENDGKLSLLKLEIKECTMILIGLALYKKRFKTGAMYEELIDVIREHFSGLAQDDEEKKDG